MRPTTGLRRSVLLLFGACASCGDPTGGGDGADRTETGEEDASGSSDEASLADDEASSADAEGPSTSDSEDASSDVSSSSEGTGESDETTTVLESSSTVVDPTAAGDSTTSSSSSTGPEASATSETNPDEDESSGEMPDPTVRPAAPEGFGRDTTGGQGGEQVTVSTGTELHRAICERAAEDTPLEIFVDGTLTPGNTTAQSGSCDTADGVIELKGIRNISVIGVEDRGVLDQVGIHIRESSNIIIQNLTIRNVRKSNTETPSNEGDAIGMENDVSHVWVDHNEIYGSTTEGEEHDGLIDFKRNCTNITISYNHLHDSGRGGLVGSNDDGDDGSTDLTFHHNWYENINSRTHLVREARAHFYNNYFSQILDTGLNVRNGASILVEGNVFTDSRNPLGTFFFLENNPVYEVHDNIFEPSVVWEATDDELPAGPDVRSTGTVSVPYSYELDPADSVPAIVRANAGVGRI